MKQQYGKAVVLFIFGGVCYNLLELLWRGYTHWTMFLLGGLCFRWIGKIASAWCRHCLLVRSTLCAAAITASEFLCGCVVNLLFGMRVWDYSSRPLNLFGQTCLLYTVLWGLLSIPAMPLYGALERALSRPRFSAPKPENFGVI